MSGTENGNTNTVSVQLFHWLSQPVADEAWHPLRITSSQSTSPLQFQARRDQDKHAPATWSTVANMGSEKADEEVVDSEVEG